MNIMGDTFQIMITMVVYMLAVIVIGLAFARRANHSSEAYFLGGRSLGPWVTAMSAEASDMSGWLLMGLPGVAYWCGIADASWTAIGLGIGTYINWLITSKRLRRYSEKAGNAITLPEFFSNRYHEKNKVIGGFLAESASDFMQSIVMILALVIIVVTGTAAAGGLDAVLENARSIPGFLDFFGIATPVTDAAGVQQVVDGVPQFGEAGVYGALNIVSMLAWGLGYFGMPQVLLRFMAIRSEKELTTSRRIATVWVVISLVVAVFIGVVGRTLFPTALTTASEAENVFILLSTNLLPPLLAGLVMAGILAATISSSDSYLLIAASAFAKNIYQGLMHRKANDRQVLTISRIALLAITAIAIVIALDENSVIFTIVSFAWAGFGATFGPLMLFSLFWKRTNRAGAIAGMIGGGSMVFIWNLFISKLGGIWDIYELLPAFLFSCLCIVVVSLITAPPSEEIQKEFDEVRAGQM